MRQALRFLFLFIPGVFSIHLGLYAEGTKQIRPDSTNSFGALRVDRNSANYTRFAYINCPANYRLYIHTKNAGKSILFGLKPPSANINYNLKKPNGTIALTGTLSNTVGQPGYIQYFHQAVVGPFPANGGYSPLSYTVPSIADTGNYYFEITNNSGSSTYNFDPFDFQVVSGAHTPAIPHDILKNS